MMDVFSGGLVYEFTNEPNNYGLVEVQDNGDIKLLPDFFALKNQYKSLPKISYNFDNTFNMKDKNRSKGGFYQHFDYKVCNMSYLNLYINSKLPKSPALSLIHDGVSVERGSLVSLSDEQLISKFKILTHNGDLYSRSTEIERVIDLNSGSLVKRPTKLKNGKFINLQFIRILLTHLAATYSFAIPPILSKLIMFIYFSLIFP